MKKVYNEIIARLICAIDAGANEEQWIKPWNHEAHAISDAQCIDALLVKYYEREKIPCVNEFGDRSFYSPAADAITLPKKEQFISIDAYNAVKAHETIHSTGDYTRCNRETFSEFKTFTFGDVRYSREELVAEIGACFLLATFGLNTDFAEYNAGAYIGNWIKHLNNNTYWIYRASELAEEAVEYIIDVTQRSRK